jgi:hypothetical protein
MLKTFGEEGMKPYEIFIKAQDARYKGSGAHKL